MSRHTVQVFFGSPQEHPSERRFLAQLRRDLGSRRIAARIFVNFVAGRHGQRQIDFLIVTETRCLHVELKSVDQDLPLLGRLNGAWQQVLPGGKRRSLEGNYFQQALEGTYAIADSMRAVARRGDAPTASSFPKCIDTVVCIDPTVPANSQLESRDHVTVVGYADLLRRIETSGAHAPWRATHWDAFSRHLGTYREEEGTPEAQRRRADDAAVAEYQGRYLAQAGGLHELIPLAGTVNGKSRASLKLGQLLAGHSSVLLMAPPGAGKTHLARHAAIEMTRHGRVVIWASCDEYEKGRFSVLLSRAIAPFTTEPLMALLDKARGAAQDIMLVLDGFNSCPEHLQGELVEQLSALRLRVPLAVLVTSTLSPPLPSTWSVIPVSIDTPEADERAAILASHGLPSGASVGDAFRTPYELALAALCFAELRPDATQTELLDAYIRREARRETIRNGLRSVARVMDSQIRTSLSVGDTIAALRRSPGPSHTIDDVLASPLLVPYQGRVRFRHDLLARLLAAEDLVITAGNGGELAQFLREPRHRDLWIHALTLETDPQRRHEALLELAEPQLLERAVGGQLGEASARQISADISGLLVESSTLLEEATLDVSAENGTVFGSWQLSRMLSDSERALLSAAGLCLAAGMFQQEVGVLLDRTDVACRREVLQLRGRGFTQAISAVVASTYALPFGSRGSSLAASLVVESLHHALMFSWGASSVGPLARPMLCDKPEPSWGRLYAAALLCRPIRHPEDASILPDLVDAAWRAGGYHLRLAALEAAETAAHVLDDTTRTRMIEVLQDLTTSNLFLSSVLVEALAAYDQITPLATLADLQGEITQLLTAEETTESCAVASRFVGGLFEREDVVGPYSQAVESLEPSSRAQLFAMATRAEPSGFHVDWITSQLVDLVAEINDAAAQALAQFAAGVAVDSFMPQTSIAAHLEAIRGWARVAEALPPTTAIGDDGRAWRNFDELVFTLYRPPTAAERTADSAWRWLLGDLRGAAVDVMHQIKWATGFSGREANLHDELVRHFPGQIRQLLQWGLAHREGLTSLLPFPDSDHRARYIVDTLGLLGDDTTIGLLHSYVLDPQLGESAVRAILHIQARGEPTHGPADH